MISKELKQFMQPALLEGVVIPETRRQNTNPIQFIPGSSDFSLEDLTDFYRVNGVNYRNGIYSVEVFKELLPSKTQNKHLEHAIQAITTDQPHIKDAPFYNSIFTLAYKNKDNPQYKDDIEKLRIFLKESISKWLMTLSRIRYTASGQDLVIHNYGMQDKLEVQANIVGADGYITQINQQNELQAILGNNDVNEINQVYNWITGKNAYLWRVNSKPEQDIERVVWFGSVAVGTFLGCGWDPGSSDRALAVRAKKIR